MIDYLIKKGVLRNPNHAIWLFSSIFVFVYILATHIYGLHPSLFILPIIFHSSPVINATRIVYFKKQVSEVYSKDCIWYNSIMIVVYLLLMYKL